ncbi:MAG: sensor histidine kinase [Thermoleophilia bacterium]
MAPTPRSGRPEPWRQAWFVDGLLMLAIAVEQVMGLVFDHGDRTGRWGTAAGLALATVAMLAIPLGRRWPLAGVLVAGAATATHFVGRYPTSLVLISPLVALYHAGSQMDRIRSLLTGLGVWLAIIVASLMLHGDPLFTVETFAKLGAAALPLAIGDAIRVRRALESASAARLAQAQRERRDHAQRLVEHERLRIARELHDILAHTMTMISVQAGVADHLFERDPNVARTAIGTIASGSREALNELRALVGVLRGDEAGEARLDPAPRLGQIEQLAEQARAGGVDLTLVTEGVAPAHIADAVHLAGYRIAQEALTNVVRHAGPVSATMRLVYEPGQIRLVCRNDAPAHVPSSASPGGQAGLIGMRERAGALGGSVRAGHTDDGGFEVVAQIPYRLTP